MSAVPLELPADVPVADRLAALRRKLAGKFPAAEYKPAGFWPTGLAALDAPEGGLRRGAVTEFCATPGNGAAFIHLLLEQACRVRTFAALIDTGGTFDPGSAPPAALARLLWISCQDAGTAVKAADLLLRDGNLPLLLLDFQMLDARHLSRIPATTWHRFQHLAESASPAFVILTTKPVIESAQVRITQHNRWTLQAQRRRRDELFASLDIQIIPRRTVQSGFPRAGSP